ncbi:hypothetical protein QKT49_gp296 [Acanthamoeba castellanii medusavirus]|uniref:Uncharacterized protein n=1 Tax=Acanthamoeba castellanii medusavirus J1 TaxID=3114988 RepID=A0A3T1CX91_9VIRU|nr:hypothetical protein QKT49_gp296 [Acanthamoeba castellanii medusavirus]BBI30467.1 hypothetical protein [Acanthamoeba castellanii medusavirus J1]
MQQQQQEELRLVNEYLRCRPPGQSAFFGIVPTPRELSLPPGQCTDDDVIGQACTEDGEPADIRERLTWRPHFPVALLPHYLPDRLCYTLHIRGVYYYYSTRPRPDPADTATLHLQKDDFHFECVLDPWGRPFNCPCTHGTDESKCRLPMETHDRFVQCTHCKKFSHWDCLSGHDVDYVVNEAEWVCDRSRSCREIVAEQCKLKIKKKMPEDEREVQRMRLLQMIAASKQRREEEEMTAMLDEMDEELRCMNPAQMHEDGPCPV